MDEKEPEQQIVTPRYWPDQMLDPCCRMPHDPPSVRWRCTNQFILTPFFSFNSPRLSYFACIAAAFHALCRCLISAVRYWPLLMFTPHQGVTRCGEFLFYFSRSDFCLCAVMILFNLLVKLPVYVSSSFDSRFLWSKRKTCCCRPRTRH